jgi:uncharacterized protein (DUF1501 family)
MSDSNRHRPGTPRIIDDAGFSPTRRRVLQGSAAWLAGAAGSAAFGLHSVAAAAAMAQPKNATDYKALVCVFLFGGNDSGNTVIPYDAAEHLRYITAREGAATRPYGITRLRDDLLPLPALPDGRVVALPKEMAALKGLYERGRAAIVANVGLLAAPITRAQFDNGSVAVPPQLFSHSDQANFWQSMMPSYGSDAGWGGRIVDLMAAANADARVSAAISVAGTNLWQVGRQIQPFPIDATQGAVSLFNRGDDKHGRAFEAMLAAPRDSLLEQELVRVLRRSISGEEAIRQAYAGTTAMLARFPTNAPAGIPGPASGWHEDLMRKLAGVARMVASGESLGVRRQVFFVAIGGFDMHNSLEHHRYALQAISDGLAAFDAAMVAIGKGDAVTAFTASDFGRPLQTNGTGSDHGWGAHHLVVGGAVRGGRVLGTFPGMEPRNGPEYTGSQGHMIPSTSVDQYAGAMARWMGVPDSDLPLVLPNVGRFGALLPMF